MNANKPVAWIDPKELDMDVSTSVTKHKQFDTDIPLYTHPAKTLTDKELVEIYQELSDDFDKNPFMNDENCYRIFPIEIGRAILKKAKEK